MQRASFFRLAIACTVVAAFAGVASAASVVDMVPSSSEAATAQPAAQIASLAAETQPAALVAAQPTIEALGAAICCTYEMFGTKHACMSHSACSGMKGHFADSSACGRC
ncbi:hypothetical protein KFE25_001698 [Diacronema lutheri]|uniref:Uncharacterized protein n=2 Tax=Diacronema lutheri TaxID=2081491 RepID=A0A8J5XP87_DIALT|nr:hypothetical protein KFE25_001698 [Diacronema lutheri]